MRNLLLAVALAATVTMPVSAAPFGHTRNDREVINDGLKAMADMCVREFDFTRVPKRSDAVLVDKMEAYLLLAPSVDDEINNWAVIVHNAHEMDRAEKDEAMAERLADALIAAQKDPDSYGRAEALYVSTMRAPVDVMVGACRSAVNNGFIGTNYLTGNGSADQYDARLRELFAEGVKEGKQ